MTKNNETLATMSKDNLPKAVLLLAWPIIIEMLLQSTVGIADIAMVGRINPAAIAAVGLGNQFIMLLLTVFAAVRTGVTVLVARTIGAEDLKGANDAARQALLLTLFFGTVVAFIGVVFPEAGFRLLGAGEDVIAEGIGYIRFRAMAAFFACIVMTVTGILRGCGNTMTAMKVNVLMNVLNVFFNWVLIFGNLGLPAMGTSGAGAGTMFSRLIGAILMLYVLFAGDGVIKLHISDSYKPKLSTLRRIFTVGIPAGIEQVFMRGAQLFFTTIVTGLGTTIYAAHQIVFRADSLAFMPGFGFAVAATTLVGQNLGAKQYDEAKRAGKITMYMAMALLSLVGVLLFLFAKPIMFFFTDDPEVIAAGVPAMKLISFSMPFLAIARVSAGALRGAGDTKFVMWGTGISIWFARLGLAFVLVNFFHLGLIGAWIGMFADHVVRATIFLVRFLKGNWVNIEI